MQHGKRADAIVKNMLLHSQSHSGAMEHTDLNALADEYLKLSYHGFRAKNKLFTCTIKTSFDESIESINIVPQDIGRILVNLYNNAFYAVNEKIKIIRSQKEEAAYEPILLISTKKKGNKAVITVKDNGIGIPQKFIDKIFQPFFTTKPAGGGTGLGLSLSYDIIKAHQGSLTVASAEGKFAEFCIELNY